MDLYEITRMSNTSSEILATWAMKNTLINGEMTNRMSIIANHHCRKHECNDIKYDCKESQKSHRPCVFVLTERCGSRGEKINFENGEHNCCHNSNELMVNLRNIIKISVRKKEFCRILV
jgi:hypothetical protein